MKRLPAVGLVLACALVAILVALVGTGPAPVAPAQAQYGPETTISVANVRLPSRLVIDRVAFSPSPVRALGPITGRFHVSDTEGRSVSGAVVRALGLPYSRVTVPAETATGADGWATMTFHPDKFFPRNGYITFFLRARKPGEDPLAGVSTRRLVQVIVRR